MWNPKDALIRFIFNDEPDETTGKGVGMYKVKENNNYEVHFSFNNGKNVRPHFTIREKGTGKTISRGYLDNLNSLNSYSKTLERLFDKD